MDTEYSRQDGTRRTAIVIGATFACVLLVAAVVWHGAADSAYHSSSSLGVSLDERYARAYAAAALEPWNARYAARVRYVAAWVRADTLLSAGDYLHAVALLSATIGHTLAEPDLLALYHRAQEIQTVETNRKAHLQHGHEGPGGTLRPQDIER